MSLIIGFTGTAQGMTDRQYDVVQKIMINSRAVIEAHHGDCVGADAQFHAIVRDAPRGRRTIVIHPPINPVKRAWCGYEWITRGTPGDIQCGPVEPGVTILPECDYIQRNHDIVHASLEMLATPKTMEEELRSGTWATIRHSKKVGRKTTIVWSNGAVDVIYARVSAQGVLL